MSRFADSGLRSVVPLGPCACPGGPHEQDEALVRCDLGASALARIGRAALDGAARLDPMASYRQIVLEAVESWNLLWPDPGSSGPDRPAVAVPIMASTVEEMDLDTLKALAEGIDTLLSTHGAVPNASGARSPGSRRASASRTRRPTLMPTT